MINYNDNFYNELSDLVEDIDLEAMKSGDTVTVEDCDLEPIMTLTADNLLDCTESIWEERTSENGDEYESMLEAFKYNIEFEKLNAAMPKLWYPNGKEIIYTYEQLLEAAK